MKRFFPFVALLAVVAMVGCSGDSPTAKPVPTVVPSAWGITSLTIDPPVQLIGAPVTVTATVTKDGSPVPDGTTVKFSSEGPGKTGFFGFTAADLTKKLGNLRQDGSVISEGGKVTVYFLATDDPSDDTDNPGGSYKIQAQVGNVATSKTVTYVFQDVTAQLQIFSINPNRGSYTGGQVATIIGKGILPPVDVFFDLNGVAYQAQVVETEPSAPEPSDLGSITVIVPTFGGANTSIEQAADVRVIVFGSGVPESDTLPQAYRLLPGLGVNIFGVVPNSGRASGGEIVDVLGQGFGANASALTVSFIWPAEDPTNALDIDWVKFGTVLAVSPDGTQIEVETPSFFGYPRPPFDVVFDVKVSAPKAAATAFDAFVVIAENPQPEITSFSPTSGPLDGGTLVTIFGHGFQTPMQVFFGNLTALDVNVFNDTTPGDNDRITCVTPDYSQVGDVPPVGVDIRVINMTSGLESSKGVFTFGDPLWISGNSPSEGGLGDLVVIFGSGFEDPLQVFLGGDQMEVVSVSGTELVVRIPDDLATQCSATTGVFRVVLLESNQETSGGNFTIRGNTPLVLSVTPVILQETGTSPSGLSPNAITINGQQFSEEVLVSIGTFVAPSADVDRVSDSSIDVQNLPGPDDLGISFDVGLCTTGIGQTGLRQVATSVSVTVTNFPGNCANTLAGAIVIEPFDQTCVVASGISLSSLVFPPTQAPGPSPGQTLTITETTGATPLVVNSLNLTGRFFFDAGCSLQGQAGFTIPAGTGNSTVQVYFCPDTDNGAPYTGGLLVLSDSPSSPTTQTLNGQEAFPILGVSPSSLNYTTSPRTQSFTISNTGTGDLNWNAVPTGTGFAITSASSGTVTPGNTASVDVQYSGGSGTSSGSVTVTATEPDAQGSPAMVTLSAIVP